MSEAAKVQAAYGAEQIQVLEGLEPVRKRPGMYIGTTGPRGTDVHARALTHRLQAFKNLNLLSTVGGLNFCGFAHALVVGPATFSTSTYHRYPRDARRSL